MSISAIGKALDVDNWVIIATDTASGVGTKSFTSIPTVYRKLMVKWHSIVPDSTADLRIEFNAVTTANKYASFYDRKSSSAINPYVTNTKIGLEESCDSNNSYLGYLEIDSANTVNAKLVKGFNANKTGAQPGGYIVGFYEAVAAITQVDFKIGSGNISGTVILLGAK